MFKKNSKPPGFFKNFVNTITMNHLQNLDISNSRLKFTRGEKCIFTHVVLTFCLILFAVMTYLVHLYLVNHNAYTLFSTRRLGPIYSSSVQLDAVPVGIIYLNITPLLQTCNTLLLRRQWSLGPGHCIALMSQPDLTSFLYEWRVKYKNNNGVKIKRSLIHPHFDTDTFENNIGVIHHNNIIGLQEYNLPNTNYEKVYNNHDSDGKLIIISWLKDSSLIKDNMNHLSMIPAQILPKENCLVQMAPIVNLRSYETCAVFEKVVYISLEHGALALQLKNLQVFGFFTWGDKVHRIFPLVILNLSYFQEWIDTAMTF